MTTQNRLSSLSKEAKQYLVITANYWAFTLSDGALRMLVVLYFHQLGYTPLQVALLFLFYEVSGVITNLLGGYLGARFGLNKTMNYGLAFQIIALAMLLAPTSMMTIAWVMCAQALSGIAKDLNKMSAKSAIKSLISADQQTKLFKWVAILTGSKNTLKGLGFFIGGGLLSWCGFHNTVLILLITLSLVWLFSLFALNQDLGKASGKIKLTHLISKNTKINLLSAARLFLFGARDIWFVVALPVYLSTTLQWQNWQVGSLLALWVIFYGIAQAATPLLSKHGFAVKSLSSWALILCAVTLLITLAIYYNIPAWYSLLPGLFIFGSVFAINSATHSYLIVDYADADKVAMDVGFYYMANAMGRLIGTVLSGLLFQQYGLSACLLASSIFILLSYFFARKLS